MKKLQLFDQNHGLSTLQKCQFFLLFKSMFILSRKACLLTRTSPNTFSGSILHKTKRSKHFKVSTKTMDHGPKPWTLCKNANFVGFWNRCFSCSERLVCYLKRQQTLFLDLFLIYTKHEKIFNFLTKIMDYPLCKNANFAFFLNPCLYCLERLVF